MPGRLQRGAARELGKTGDKRAIEPLRRAAGIAGGRATKAPTSEKPPGERLTLELIEADELRLDAGLALADLGDKSAEVALASLLESEISWIRLRAGEHLAKRGDTEAVEALGHKPVVVDTVSQVVSAVRSKDCRAVVCDVTSLDAEEASACFLKAALALAGGLPFVAVSPVRSMRPTVLALNHGARHVLPRPFTGPEATASELGAALGERPPAPGRPGRSSGPTRR